MTHAKTSAKLTLNLALQGGGSHGAYSWGVLDRLLDETDFDIEGVSGTSAGAMNAAILAHGWAEGGRSGAKQALSRFWEQVGAASILSPVHRSFYDMMIGNWNLDGSPVAMWSDLLGHIASPYQTNPMNVDPLRSVLERSIDFEVLRKSPLKLFICATNVRTGRARIFENRELTIDALLASACLPFLFQSIVIDGDAYWDGGYSGNPSLWPLIYGCDSRDIVLVQINPLERPGTPRTPAEIANRVNEISFNSPLMNEMRAIAFVEGLIENDHLSGGAIDRYKKMHIHRIHAEDEMRALGAASKMDAEPDFLAYLKDLGQKSAEGWLVANRAALGKKSSVDLRATYL